MINRYLAAACCSLLAAGCSHDRPAETAANSSESNVYSTSTERDPDLTPASTAGEKRAVTSDTSSHNDGAAATTSGTSTVQSNSPAGTTPDHTATSQNNTAASSSDASKTPAKGDGKATQPDNTRVNKRDADSKALTPMDQGNNETDLELTRQIRQAVMGDGSLSFTAKNVKIISSGGKVTLRGPVQSDKERASIEAAAKRIAGPTNVDNQLEVKK